MTQKDAYVAKLKAQLDAWNAELTRWQAQAQKSGTDARVKYEQQLADLKRQRDHASQKLKEVQSASSDTWETTRANVEETWTGIRAAFDKAKARWR